LWSEIQGMVQGKGRRGLEGGFVWFGVVAARGNVTGCGTVDWGTTNDCVVELVPSQVRQLSSGWCERRHPWSSIQPCCFAANASYNQHTTINKIEIH
jgi:hypothetical protein